MAKNQGPLPDKQYWDACVFTAYIGDEPGRADVVHQLLQQCDAGEIEVFTSLLSLAECAFAEIEKTKNELSLDTLEKIDALWHPPSKIKIIEIHELVAIEARDLVRIGVSKGISLKGADAIHLASAKRVEECKRIFTYDDKHLPKWETALGMPIGNPSFTKVGLF